MTMFIDELQKEQQGIHKQLQQLEIKQTEMLANSTSQSDSLNSQHSPTAK